GGPARNGRVCGHARGPKGGAGGCDGQEIAGSAAQPACKGSADYEGLSSSTPIRVGPWANAGAEERPPASRPAVPNRYEATNQVAERSCKVA
ncbi:MAG: hypothetical protein ACTHQQ_11195, partial [Solirubrobacteraceae bacterium]